MNVKELKTMLKMRLSKLDHVRIGDYFYNAKILKNILKEYKGLSVVVLFLGDSIRFEHGCGYLTMRGQLLNDDMRIIGELETW